MRRHTFLRTAHVLLLIGLLAVPIMTGCERRATDARSTSPSDTAAAASQPGAPGATPLENPKNQENTKNQESPRNQALQNAASPFEDLTEYAEAGNEQGMAGAVTSFKRQASGVSGYLSSPARSGLDSLVAAIDRARQSGDHTAVALNAVEAYRVLVEALDTSALVVPRDVAMLDYAGFKLHVLAGAPSPDWQATQATADEARAHWEALRPSLHDAALRDAVGTAVDGMTQSVQARDARMARFAAEVDLTLVDLIEGYYERAGTVPLAAPATEARD